MMLQEKGEDSKKVTCCLVRHLSKEEKFIL
jgi:hypothetical protein